MLLVIYKAMPSASSGSNSNVNPASAMEFRNVVFNAARDGKLRRLKVGKCQRLKFLPRMCVCVISECLLIKRHVIAEVEIIIVHWQVKPSAG